MMPRMRTREGAVNSRVTIERCTIESRRCGGLADGNRLEGHTRRIAGGVHRVDLESTQGIPGRSIATGASATSPSAARSPGELTAMTSCVRWSGGLFLDPPHAQPQIRPLLSNGWFGRLKFVVE